MVKMSTEIATMLDSIKSIVNINQPTPPTTCDTLNVNHSPSCTTKSDVSHAVAVSDYLSQVVKAAS